MQVWRPSRSRGQTAGWCMHSTSWVSCCVWMLLIHHTPCRLGVAAAVAAAAAECLAAVCCAEAATACSCHDIIVDSTHSAGGCCCSCSCSVAVGRHTGLIWFKIASQSVAWTHSFCPVCCVCAVASHWSIHPPMNCSCAGQLSSTQAGQWGPGSSSSSSTTAWQQTRHAL